MSVFWGLPDFGTRVQSDYEVYAPFEGGSYVLLPDSLYVQENDEGTAPMFHVTLHRTKDSDDPNTQYGELQIGLARGQHLTEALSSVRHAAMSSTLIPIAFDRGWIRMVPGSNALQLPPELANPTPLGWGGLDFVRWTLRITSQAGELLKACLKDTTIISARAEVLATGVAPRVNFKVTFNPKDLNTQLSGLLDANRQIGQPQLISFLSTTSPGFTVSIDGDVPTDQVAAFGEAVAARVMQKWGTFVAAPAGQEANYLQIATADKFEDGQMMWDLSQPIAVTRGWVFTLDPFATARQLVATAGLDALVSEFTEDPLKVGWWRVKADAILPQSRVGVLSTGVSLNIPPRLPFRPQPVSQTLELAESQDDTATTEFQLSAAEKLHYNYSTFFLLQQGAGVRRVDGPAAAGTSPFIELQKSDFPGTFYQYSADAHLMQLAKLNGMLAYQDNGNPVAVPFTLDSGHLHASLVAPAGATDATLTVIAQPLGPGAPITLGPDPAADRQYSLASFIQYGPQSVNITVHFNGPVGLYVIDLIAEGKSDTPDNVTTLTFAPDQTTAVWQYTTDSPFQSGYKYRVHGVGAPWSALRGASAPLELSGGGHAAPAGTFDLRGVHLYLSAADGPNVFRYIAADPSPALDATGKPNVLVVDGSDGGMLQMGVRWLLDADSQALVESDLMDKRPDLSAIQLQPAPVTVSAVTVSVGDGAGNWTAITTTGSSGFPPFDALIAAHLTADQKKQVIAALNGTAKALKVDYQIDLPPTIAATFPTPIPQLIRSADVSSWFTDGSGPAHIQHSDAALS